MIGSNSTFSALFQATQRFVIPVFQRNYDWRMENCIQLYNDLIKIVYSKRKSHFFGSFVVVRNPNGTIHEYTVVDGQQRLTTTTLLLLAMYNLIDQGIIIPNTSDLKDTILTRYLINLSPQQKAFKECAKLKPIQRDQEAFYKLFEDRSEYIKDSNLTRNYNYFCKQLQNEKTPIEEIFSAIEQLGIINIVLDSEDNPQLVFESLNSTGLALSESDKIRNYLFMDLEPAQQEEYYSKYWKKIEKNTGKSLDMFFRDYLSVKTSSPPSKDTIYFAFKAYREDSELQIEPLLKNIQEYSCLYKILLGSSQEYDSSITTNIVACIRRLNHLKRNIVRPFFLEVLRLYKGNQLSLKEVEEIFKLTESYIVRRLICGIPTQGLNKMYVGLHNEILRLDGTSYLEKYKYTLLTKRKEIHQIPTDEEFAQAFVTRSTYRMTYKNLIYILERLENFGTKEVTDVYQCIETGVYSVEHIMPQTLTTQWIRDLGVDHKEIHKTWLHKIANLTLTAYNSHYRNKSFAEKRDCINGFKDSRIHMNQQIAQKEHWGKDELEERSEKLAKLALTIWERPQTVFVPSPKELIRTLQEENDSLDMSSDRHILRQAFWDYAVPILRKHNQNSRAFDKVNRSAENGLNGRIGMHHFYLTAMANYDKAKAALSFVSNDKAKNKSVFDELYRHKDEIEKELGVALVWERNDDNKSSKIYFALNNVSITKREDWDKMAEFQGIWCARFYDKIVVPYLKPMFSKQ